MNVAVSYMGTKRQLATEVAKVASNSSSNGPLLDLFSGMCSVAREVSDGRTVWCNDTQVYANSLATAEFCSARDAIDFHTVVSLVEPLYFLNISKLEKRFSRELENELTALTSKKLSSLRRYMGRVPNIATDAELERERRRLKTKPDTKPYRLLSITFGASYFSLRQCSEFDSIRFASDALLSSHQIDPETHRWMVLALCQAASRVSNTTGHFAQYLKPNPRNMSRIVSQFVRSGWDAWIEALQNCRPRGSASWRSSNRAFLGDANQLLTDLKAENLVPGVVYADPPYKADQYSRYYHLYETIILYDYPNSTGVGRYRDERFASHYSQKTNVNDALENLVFLSSQLGSDLILSYPSNGILKGGSAEVLKILRRHYPHSNIAYDTEYQHSSLGASKGFEKHKVREFVYHSHH